MVSPVVSDRDRIIDELSDIELFLASTDTWSVEVSKAVIRRDLLERLLKQLGKKDWL